MSKRLSSAQRFVVRHIENPVERNLCLRGRYLLALGALQRKGLVSFNERRWTYELTEAGRLILSHADGGAL